ncbi:hypothetical protein SELMODRAFT_408480 [Selaginella moellendorffii]|uniref:Uncharacterized protein n=1 Tax=Selaginella moellendorffii TaxID=88036 RepID=D8R8F8_SELML|nr:uncharacterized protein LOC9632327 [Selaginella moellendorffii]EFJ32058.1 hypothetical protein SELMODRAFT_408480 [Selaginella moellendorffii]|eukprot:XP_002967459.1 uncharacterized protein LOC9632327 [Selaginella moellendorffii]
MSTETPGAQRRPVNKRVNAEGGGFNAAYPHKAFKTVVATPPTNAAAATPGMDGQLCTPFQQTLKEAYSTPSTGRTLTPLTPKLSGKRDVVHRLRQQLKNRDEMIMQMQTQILEQSRIIQVHQLRIGDLELLLTAANRSLFVAEQEIEQLQKLLAECCSCRSASCQVRKRGSLHVEDKVFKAQKRWTCENQHKDMRDLVSEARRLTEKLKVVGENKRGQAREYEKEVRRVRSELSEAKNLASKNASLFQACDKERAKLSGTLTKLQQKLESQAIKLEHRRASRFSEFSSDPVAVCTEGQESENMVDASAPMCSSASHSSSVRTGMESGDFTAYCRDIQSPPPSQRRWEDEISQLSFEMKQVVVRDKEQDSPKHSTEESPVVRIGSPEAYVRTRSRKNSSSDSSDGSFKRFVFDMNRDSGGGVVMLNHTDESYFGTRILPAAGASQPASTATLSPFSKMMAKLDLLQPSPAASLTDSLIVVEKIERSIGSVDSAFDRILYDNTLDDMVRVCSPPDGSE